MNGEYTYSWYILRFCLSSAKAVRGGAVLQCWRRYASYRFRQCGIVFKK